MTFTTEEIREVYKHEIIGVRTGKGGTIPLSKCNRGGAEFSKVKSLSHGFMLRDVVKIRRKNPVKVKAVTQEAS